MHNYKTMRDKLRFKKKVELQPQNIFIVPWRRYEVANTLKDKGSLIQFPKKMVNLHGTIPKSKMYKVFIVSLKMNNPCKLVLLIFNQELTICFHSEIAVLLF